MSIKKNLVSAITGKSIKKNLVSAIMGTAMLVSVGATALPVSAATRTYTTPNGSVYELNTADYTAKLVKGCSECLDMYGKPSVLAKEIPVVSIVQELYVDGKYYSVTSIGNYAIQGLVAGQTLQVRRNVAVGKLQSGVKISYVANGDLNCDGRVTDEEYNMSKKAYDVAHELVYGGGYTVNQILNDGGRLTKIKDFKVASANAPYSSTISGWTSGSTSCLSCHYFGDLRHLFLRGREIVYGGIGEGKNNVKDDDGGYAEKMATLLIDYNKDGKISKDDMKYVARGTNTSVSAKPTIYIGGNNR